MMTPMLFSVSYAGYWGQHRLGIVEFLQKAAALGYKSVEIGAKRPHLSPLDYRGDEQLAVVRKAAATAGVEIGTVAAYTDFTVGHKSPEVPLVEMQVAYVREAARMAKGLGAKLVRVFSGYYTEPASYQADWNRCVTALRESADMAAEFGVVVGLQNHHDVGVAVDAFVELLDEVNRPNLQAMFDPWSPALHGADLYTAAKRLAPRMVQTTLADYVRLERFAYQQHLVNYTKLEPAAVRAVPLGDGFIDYLAFFAGLKEGGFRGYVAYEMCSPLRGGGSEQNLDAAARLSLDRIQRWIGS
ncbi:MAG: sugar phosphate isomerase/epimerase family protein [Pirellulales bacterium]